MLNESFFFKRRTLAVKRKHILKSKKDIDALFDDSNRIHATSLSLVFQVKNDRNYPFKVAFSVPKRNIRMAYQRNLIKRRLREAFRSMEQQVESLSNRRQLSIHIMFVYRSKKILPIAKIMEDMNDAILKCVNYKK